MPANERSLDDQLVPTARHRRRRLLTHGIVFAGAGLLATTLASSATSAAPTVQDGRFLQGGTVNVTYACTGADQASLDVLGALAGLGLTLPFSQALTITSSSVTPAPSPGEDFDVDFTWDATLNQTIVDVALLTGGTSLQLSNAVNAISATA